MAANWQIGDKIQGRWEIRRILRGHLSIVYIVYNSEFNKSFAVKTFQDEVFAWSPTIAERFMQEAVTWVCLDLHPNITQAQMMQRIEDKPFLFLEYVSGGDLSNWIGASRLTKDLRQVLSFAIQFCKGMTHAISRGIKAHGGIKPQNCLITEDDTLKVTDFGLARVFDKVDTTNWGKGKAGKREKGHGGLLGQIFGKHLASSEGNVETSPTQDPRITFHGIVTGVKACAYKAPEQFDDVNRVDMQTDIYSFGVLLFQMITGRLPFIGQTWQEFAQLHKTQPPPALGIQHPALRTMVEACLAKDPGDRFVDFGRVQEQLTELYEALLEKPVVQPVTGPDRTPPEEVDKEMPLNSLKEEAQEEDADLNFAETVNLRTEHLGSNKGVALEASKP
ncbi:MAG: serine/threonine protein kinase, partial [Nitrospira sp.]|nr:serine/threonine protein kinase [Nitrospira sp.]